MDARLGDNFQKGSAGSVIVDSCKMGEVFEHSRIIFNMSTIDLKHLATGMNRTSFDQRIFKLGDLVVTWAIGVEVRFSIKGAYGGNFSIDGQAKLDRLSHDFFVQDRE